MKTKQELTKIRKKAKSDGAAFELRVRKDMTEKGWVVDKFGLNVEFIDANEGAPTRKAHLIVAKNKWAGIGRPMMMGAGFPDFVCFKYCPDAETGYNYKQDFPFIKDEDGDRFDELYARHLLIGVECKCDGYLSQLERQKCRWLLDNNIFSKILIAEKTKPKNRIVIVYHDFEEKYDKKL